jgi:hypothetical protein
MQSEAVRDAPLRGRSALRSAARMCAAARSTAGLLLFLLASAAAAGEEQAWGVQLHLHGSLSEGYGSMAGHHYAAEQLGGAVDVLWWTDHDWRIAAHTYVDGYGFEEGMQTVRRMPATLRASQLDGREPLPRWAREGAVVDPEATESGRVGWQRQRGAADAHRAKLQISTREAREGAKSLRVELDSRGAQWERVALGFGASRRRHIASLASDVRVRLSLLPERMRGDARITISFILSQQPPAHRARLDYRLSAAGKDASERVHITKVVPGPEGQRSTRVAIVELPWQPGQWNDFEFDLSADAAQHGLGGADNSMAEVIVSLEARQRGRVSAYMDRFEIERTVVGPPLFERQKRMAAELGDAALTHYVGQEISYGAHLNAYGPRVPLADSHRHPHGYTPTQAVDLVREHGGIVSLNHVFGVEEKATGHNFPSSRPHFDDRVERLVALRGYGADLLEVGYRERGYGLRAFVELWDTLSKADIYMTGVGVSDSHDNDAGWRTGPNNFITWVLAETREEGALIEALRSGRAFFGDPTRFDGRMDVVSDGGGRMGDVVVTAAGEQVVRFRVQGLRAGQSLRLLRDGRPLRTISPADAEVEVRERISVLSNTFVRFEIIDQGEIVALSNPLYFVLPEQPVPAWRRVGRQPTGEPR